MSLLVLEQVGHIPLLDDVARPKVDHHDVAREEYISEHVVADTLRAAWVLWNYFKLIDVNDLGAVRVLHLNLPGMLPCHWVNSF